MSQDTSELIEQRSEQIRNYPYNERNYNEIIAYLRLKDPIPYIQIHEIRTTKLLNFSPDIHEISEWLEDLLKVDVEDLRFNLICDYYEHIVKIYPTVYYWGRYIEFVLDNYYKHKDFVDESITKELFLRSLNDTVHDFKNSSVIWSMLLKFFENIYKNTHLEHDLISLDKLHLKRLSYPHNGLEDSFSEYSGFISSHFQENYEEKMVFANKIYTQSMKAARYYDDFELKLAKSNDAQVWISYMHEVHKFAHGDYTKVSSIFYRFLVHQQTSAEQDDNVIYVWLSFIYIIYESKGEYNQILEETLSKFIKTYPQSPICYAEFIRNCELFEDPLGKYSSTLKRVEASNVMENSSYDDWKVLASAILSFEFSNSGKWEEGMSVLQLHLKQYVEFAINQNFDVNHTIERLAISIYEKLDEIDSAYEVVKRLVQKFDSQTDIWRLAFEFSKRNEFPYEVISSLLEDAASSVTKMDRPEEILQEWLIYEQLNGDLDTYKNALVKTNNVLREINSRRMDQSQLVEHDSRKLKRKLSQLSVEETENKRDRKEKPRRRREECSVKLLHLPADITEGKVRDFLKDCGTPKEVKIFENGDDYNAIVEFSSEQEVFSSMTKNFKKIDGREIEVTRILQNTLWVCNFPPSMSHESLKSMFESKGRVINVRFPSLVSNKKRRFCYVEFSSPEEANYAKLELDQKLLKDEQSGKYFTLTVDISIPNASRRNEEPDQKREIYILNLDFKKVSENTLSGVFSRFGDIDSITLPISEEQKAQGNLNRGYAFVVFHSQHAAKNALQLNGATVEGRKMLVTPSKRDQTTSNPTKTTFNINNYDNLRSISVFNVSDTINSDQIANHFNKIIGSVSKVETFPEHKAAIVEFQSPIHAGKVVLSLDAATLDGKSLEFGLRNDILKLLYGTKNKEKKNTLMVPTQLRIKK